MALVLIASQSWGVLQTRTGNARAGKTVTLSGTVYSDSGGTVPLSPLTTNANGEIPGYIATGTYTLTDDTGAARQVEATSGAMVTKEAVPYAILSSLGPNIDTGLTDTLATLGANGGRIVLPRGALNIVSPPSFKETRNIVLEGAGGPNAGAVAPTSITYKGTAARGIDARSSFGFGLRDLQLFYDQAGFTGHLIDFGWSAASLDSADFKVEHCYLGGSGVSGAASLTRVTKAIVGHFENTVFQHAQRHVRGLEGSDYSNVMQFNNCTFLNHVVASIASCGESWQFDVCNWAAKQDGSAGAFLQDFGNFEGLTLNTPWMGDVNTLGTWLNGSGHGLKIDGGNIGGGARGVLLGNGCKAFDISCVTFDTVATPIEYGQACSGYIGPNRYLGYTTGPVVDGGTLSASTQGIIGQTDSDTYLRGRWKATEGLHLPTKAGSFSDADFPTDRPPISGLIGGVDTTSSKVWVRFGSTWKSVTFT